MWLNVFPLFCPFTYGELIDRLNICNTSSKNFLKSFSLVVRAAHNNRSLTLHIPLYIHLVMILCATFSTYHKQLSFANYLKKIYDWNGYHCGNQTPDQEMSTGSDQRF